MNKSPSIGDPFVEYYEQQSSSSQTIAQFEKLKNSLLRILGRPDRAEGVRVLDIGCGAGTFSRIWASHGAFVRGIDVNDALVEIAKERAQSAGLSIEFVVGTATSLPWADRSVDVVVMPELLEHVTEWRCCLEEAVRVLDEGGVLYLSTSNRLCPKQDEFSLPMYSWYPEVIKRRCLERARTDRRHWVRHAEFPALHWFDAYQLATVFRELGMEPYDRFQVWSRYSPSASRRVIGRVAEALPPVRLMGHVLTSYTTIIGKKMSR